MEITHPDYQVNYDAEAATVTWSGALRLQGSDYQPIVDLMNSVVAAQAPTVTLDLRQLEYLNSFGINVLSRFVMQLDREASSRLVVRASDEYAWQRKSLRLIPRLMQDATVEFGA
jgi:hypothetical protein